MSVGTNLTNGTFPNAEKHQRGTSGVASATQEHSNIMNIQDDGTGPHSNPAVVDVQNGNNIPSSDIR
jgi:hypothetical protein